MWTERDQIQAYQFLRRRLVSALVTSDPNHPTSPHRRLVMGTVLGTVATMLTAAGFGISGMMAPSPPPDWQHTGLVIVDSDGGGRYVLDNTGVLHPVTNLASARLLANGTKTVTVTTALLRNTPRGATLGIANAPDMLPDPANVIPAPDPVACSRATSDIPKVTGPVGALLLANAGDATSALNGMVPLPDGRALLVQTPKGERYLITGGLKYKVADDAVMTALGYQAATILPAAASWLSTLPSGRDLALVTVPNVGGSGPRVGGTKRKVGEVLTVNNTVTDKTLYYLVQAGGLEQIPQIEAALIVADNANAAAYTDGPQQPRAVSVSDATATPSTPAGDDTKGYPAGVPTPVGGLGGGTVVCAVGDGTTPAQIALSGTFPLPAGRPHDAHRRAPGRRHRRRDLSAPGHRRPGDDPHRRHHPARRHPAERPGLPHHRRRHEVPAHRRPGPRRARLPEQHARDAADDRAGDAADRAGAGRGGRAEGGGGGELISPD